jgi:hypothetical protein
MRASWRKRTQPRCGQSWEVEAARDGRLSGVSLEVVARHIERCDECRELSSYFAGLGRAMRGLDVLDVDDIAAHRLRRKLLGRVDAEIAGRSLPPPASRELARRSAARRYLLLPLVATFAVIVGLATRSWMRAPSLPALSQAPRTTVDAVDEGGAHWTQTSNRSVEWIDLSDGTLRLRVQKAPGSKRVVVRVPDGEIEDVGTVFHVVVSNGRTQRVGVDEGRVVIRLTHMAPITISSGTSWERPQESIATSTTPSAAASAAPPSIASAKRSQLAPPPSQPDLPEAPSAAKEDAAYLRMISLLRQGRDVEARAAARDYLKRFPNGFRREEMTQIAE